MGLAVGVMSVLSALTEGRCAPRVAIGHGLSTAGNEHIHVAVSLVSEEGTKASIWQDRVALSSACGEFERAYGLTIVDGRSREGLPGVSRAEDELARRRGRPEAARDPLARHVRAASVASRDEAEFVRRLRAEGVIVRPRFAQGRSGEAVGYSVALRPAQPRQEVTWYGGGRRLAKDLALPRCGNSGSTPPPLRPCGGPSGPPAAVERVLAEQGWSVAADRVAEVSRHLEHLSPTDAPRWAAVARETPASSLNSPRASRSAAASWPTPPRSSPAPRRSSVVGCTWSVTARSWPSATSLLSPAGRTARAVMPAPCLPSWRAPRTA